MFKLICRMLGHKPPTVIEVFDGTTVHVCRRCKSIVEIILTPTLARGAK